MTSTSSIPSGTGAAPADTAPQASADPANDLLACIQSIKIEMRTRRERGKRWVMSPEPTRLPGSRRPPKPGRPAFDGPCASLPETAPPARRPSRKPPRERPPARPAAPNRSAAPLAGPAPASAEIVFVRLSPSEEEMRSGRPYSDTAARTLDRIVAAIGWNPECIHKTYLSPHPLSYLPEDSPDCEQWKRRFYDDLGGASPRAILCWGERVSRILGNRKQSVEEMRRAPRRDAERGWTLFFLWEPFYFMKKLEAKKMVWRDIRAIHQFLYGDRKK